MTGRRAHFAPAATAQLGRAALADERRDARALVAEAHRVEALDDERLGVVRQQDADLADAGRALLARLRVHRRVPDDEPHGMTLPQHAGADLEGVVLVVL